MKRIYFTKQAAKYILLIISLLFSASVEAQQKQRDLNSPAYKRAIENITALSNGEINTNNIKTYLNGSLPNGGRSTDDDEFITVSPVIDIVSWNGNEDAVFTVTGFPSGSNVTDISITFSPSQPGWIIQTLIDEDNNTITIDVKANPDEEARSAELTIGATVGGTAVQDITAYIIQDGQPFLYVVPEFRSISSSAATVESFNVIHNLTNGWTYDAGTIPTDWIYDPLADNSNNTFTFSVYENDDITSRTATIKIYQQGDENVYDELTIIQGGSGKFISVIPEFQGISENGGDTEPFNIVGFNITGWEVVGSTVPDDWISATPNYQNNTIIFNVGSNANSSVSRSATITVRETDNNSVSAKLTIIQAGDAPFLYVTPEFRTVSHEGGTTGVFNIIGFNIDGWQLDEINDPDGLILSYEENHNENTINFIANANSGDTYHEAIITINDTDQNVSSQIKIVQGTESQPFIMIIPEIQSVTYSGGWTEDFEIINFNLVGWEVVNSTIQTEWITDYDPNNNKVKFKVDPNPTQELRSDTIAIQETGNSNVTDSLIIFQGPDVQPFIFTTPGFQTVTYESGTSQNVNVLNFNIEGWNWDWFEMAAENWITPEVVNNDKIKFNFEENTTGDFRIARFKIYATDIVEIFDTITIYQQANPLPEILTAPREQIVSHFGNDNITFKVTDINTDGPWTVDSDATKAWTNNFTYNYDNSTFTFTVDRNFTLHSRTDSIVVYANYAPKDSTVYDTVSVYQYSGLDSYLLAEPREHAVSYKDTTIEFKITAVNIDSVWHVDTNTVKEEWIHFEKSAVNDSILVLTIDTNYTNQTRRDSITIYATANGDTVTDNISVYQYAGPDPYLLAAPREQTVSHLGDTDVIFDITVVNIPPGGWEVDMNRLQTEWIEVQEEGNNLLKLNVYNNDLLETRIDTIWFYSLTDSTTVYDSIFIYQYSELDTFLLSAPREKWVPYIGDTIDFDVTAVNLPGGWEVDSSSVQFDWILIDAAGGDLLRLNIMENDLLETRIDTIRIFATDHDNIEDFVKVYQNAMPDPYLLAAPREYRVSHLGKDSVDFKITTVNVPGGWFVDTNTVQTDWISVEIQGADSLRFKVLQNDLLETRVDTIWFYANEDSNVYDSVFIYQYSALDTFLLAAPREQTAIYSGDSLVYEITSANVPGGWEFVTETVPAWIDTANVDNAILSLSINENPFFTTRDTTIYYRAKNYPNVYDSVTVYQYAQPAPHILASPRERKVSHEGIEDLSFDILPVNLSAVGWTVDMSSMEDWVTFDENTSNEQLLVLKIDPNESLYTRVDTVEMYAIDDSLDVRDKVIVYQYSGLDSYVLAEPREREVCFEGEDNIYFTITAVNLGEGGWSIDTETIEGWFDANQVNDSLLEINVQRNLSTVTQSATIRVHQTTNTSVNDSVTIYQYAGVSNFILAHPRERKIAHLGETDVEFVITSVNNEGWTYDPTTIKDWMIDNPHKDGDTLRFNVLPNDSLQSLVNKITVHATDSTAIRDTIVVYQYSSLDAYILSSPREQFVGINSDTVTFDILAVNLDTDWDVDPVSVDSWIDKYWKDLSNTRLFVVVDTNFSSLDRKNVIRITGLHNDSTIVDSIVIIQEAPSLIFKPYALDTVPSRETIDTIYTFSNFDNYAVVKKDTLSWYSISDNGNWSRSDSISLSYNDTIFIKIDENSSSFSHRQAFLRFQSPDLRIDKSYYIRQDEAEGIYYNIGGKVAVAGYPDSTLQDITVIVGTDTLKTGPDGLYLQEIPSGWRGTITPIVDKYYYSPQSVPKDSPVNTHDLSNDFEAYLINPRVEFTLDSTSICEGEFLSDSDVNKYPNAIITGTYQQDISYKWTSIPEDTSLNDTMVNPVFSPTVTTIYKLVMENYGLKDSASFRLIVHPKPIARDFDGEFSVCKNQAGVIYLADYGSSDGEHFIWDLPYGGSFETSPNTNIAIINWGDTAGTYTLSLETRNKFGCSPQAVEKTVTVLDEEAPKKTEVLWKNPDNILYCTDADADNYVWGWLEMDETFLGKETIVEGKNDWFFRLPEGHEFDPLKYHYFVITYFNSSSCGSRSFYNPPVDVPEISKGNIIVFPNPTDGVLNIRFDNIKKSQSGTIQLFNLSGQLIHQEELNIPRNNTTITIRDAMNQEAGIYLLRVHTEDYFFNSKIVVQ